MTAKDRSRLHRGYKRFLRQLKTKRQKEERLKSYAKRMPAIIGKMA